MQLHVPDSEGWETSNPLKVKLPTLPIVNPASKQDSADFAAHMRTLTARAQRCMMAALRRQKRYYDLDRPDKSCAVGTNMLLSLSRLCKPESIVNWN